MGKSTLIINMPLSLLEAPLPHWAKLVWCSIRSFQGHNKSAWPSLTSIGERVINPKGKPMAKSQVSEGIKLLNRAGFLAVDGRNFSCIYPEGVHDSLTNVHEGRTQPFMRDEHPVHEGRTIVHHPLTVVHEGRTPSERITIKNNNKERQHKNTSSLPSCLESYDQVAESWNGFAKSKGLSTVISITDKRKKGIRSRAASLWPQIEKLYEMIGRSRFLMGLDGKGWRVDFDFVWCTQDGHIKILEGKYTDTEPPQQHTPYQLQKFV